MNKLFKWIGILTVALLGCCAVVCVSVANSPQVREAVDRYNAPPIITLVEFNRIQPGMTYEEVVSIIGSQGVMSGQNVIQGVPGVMESVDTRDYLWQNGNGTSASVMFQNGRVNMKSQFGLE